MIDLDKLERARGAVLEAGTLRAIAAELRNGRAAIAELARLRAMDDVIAGIGR